ncbi:hypothetical protein SS1G_00479 [Sclerotinia sclerotiorum 1980 UF-70]|uniref:Formin GTPase-binding domain-containing protein n=2 Tax=Sclerotinia sclerotiorum (strain ATCC 18683 / 1980 / Ss-1) TaxID=665079 RepID=A7E5A5_SCLS1|nr:hypothetical protein SS1G_00479 [Sclerotinia sclerotiorum 1980 UF-70]APA07906.1 hypothetical protein sscle_03g026760 [Sclerotinia sclerotiorum 1980 UF-70]EDN91077.1 hypothetical protein SS1G_00479 [Sclerotinia sclerotiorum 1980 UF-70]
MATSFPYPESIHSKRPKTASVLKAFIHKRNPSEGSALSPTTSPNDVFVASPAFEDMPSPTDYTHHRALADIQRNQQTSSILAPYTTSQQEGLRPKTGIGGKGLHKKTLSAMSLKSLASPVKDYNKGTSIREKSPTKPKKTKSSTSLVGLLTRPRSSKNLKLDVELAQRNSKDKENQTPELSSPVPESTTRSPRPPIYSQFSSDMFTKQPLGGKFLEDQIDLYTPENYSPSKQRNFYNGPNTQPSLTNREGGSSRPHSTYLPSSFSIQDIQRKMSGENKNRCSVDIPRRQVSNEKKQSFDFRTSMDLRPRPSFQRSSTETSVASVKTSSSTRGSRVMAAVSNFTAKARGDSGGYTPAQTPTSANFGPDRPLHDRDIDAEFEAMLDRRNIPEHQRGKMRNLAKSMKKDFIKQDWAETAAAKSVRPASHGSDTSGENGKKEEVPEVKKKKRPRSRTFTLSRSTSKERPGDKDKKSEGVVGNKKSTESLNSGSKSLTSAGAQVAQNLIAKAKGQTPDDFVAYLRKVQKPELVEVGRLHKLRLLLRNETVAWTDNFVRQGGMEEIVGLLHRTMEVEWREEHEDALLHEVLLCLKALSTTALALQHLNIIQKTLFPALIHMLFDEEKKGPAEFTTRNIVTSLLFTYLKSATLSERATRARFLLSYLRDPEPSESQRPVDFVLDMRRQRPYRVWCKEVTNVTKEVFWIFLHNLNVIPRPDSRHAPERLNDLPPDLPYMIKHFPQELPPVPAAPYVGGVEWDATNYLASHLDIVNGCIASLPTLEERNQVREELRVSGWEKCMGSTLRLCKEKFYGGVHAGLRCWVAAAIEDDWETKDVRCGPSTDNRSPVRKNASPSKAAGALVESTPPKIDMKLSFAQNRTDNGGDAWL